MILFAHIILVKIKFFFEYGKKFISVFTLVLFKLIYFNRCSVFAMFSLHHHSFFQFYYTHGFIIWVRDVQFKL